MSFKELVVCCSAQQSTGQHWFSSMPRVVDVGWSHYLLSFLCHYDCLHLQFTWIVWILLIHQFIFLFSVLSLPFVNLQLFHRYLMWWGFFFVVVRIDTFESQENGTCAHYIMVSKNQWQLFWLATQLYPQNDWTGWQFRVNYGIFTQAQFYFGVN